MREAIIPQHPPTPPTVGADYQLSMNQVAQYNADHAFSFEASGYTPSGTTAQAGIPSHARVDSHSGESIGIGIHYNGYNDPSDYYHNGQYDGASIRLPGDVFPDMQADLWKHNNNASFSPPTPRSTIEDDILRRTTRRGRALTASTSPGTKEESPRPKASPRAKKPKPGKADKASTPKLTAPLSASTAELEHIPIKDMEQWVNRPADVRRREAERRNGYITRPMNSFMLYRSAYAERAKAWCAQNNHQIVSSVAGESWPLEPRKIRELYKEYAKVERINHQNAHPTYKFSPSKIAPPARKRRADWSDDDEPSDLEDAEWAPGTGRPRNRQARRLDRSFSYPLHGMHGDFFDRSFGPNGGGINKSSWEMTNEGRPMPTPMHNDVYNQYYQTAGYPGLHIGASFNDDARIRRAGTSPSMQFSSDHALLGLPGGNSVDLMQQMHSQATTPFDDGQLDPMLLAYDGHSHHSFDSAALQHHEYRNGRHGMVDEKLDHYSINGLLELHPSQDQYHSESWQSDPTMVSLEHESEFDKWIGEH